MFSKRERESDADIQQASAHSAREGSLTTLIVPRVDSSIHGFWSTRGTLGLIKACGEVSYWTQDCFLIPGTLTVLVNRTPIQLPAWAFFSYRILAGLNFQSERTDARKGFFSPCHPASPHLPNSPYKHTWTHTLRCHTLVLEVYAKSSVHKAETISGTLLHRLFLKSDWPDGQMFPSPAPLF